MKLSIIIPTLNEAGAIQATLEPLQAARQLGHEVILSDGGSTDDTQARSQGMIDHWICSARGRAAQMNAGAGHAQGDLLLFLHADTLLPVGFLQDLQQFWAQQEYVWGRFDVRLSGHQPMLRIVERMINLRSRWSGIATGDQAMFVRAEQFNQIGGFPAMPLMEDIALSRLLKEKSRPYCISNPLVTSSRRWEAHGILRTIMLMWWLRFQYFMGVPPERLARLYR